MGFRLGNTGSEGLKSGSWLLASMLALLSCSANALVENDFEPPPPWVEGTYVFPPPPESEAFEPFYVSAVTNNDFFLDRRSISIGEDGITRYTLVVRSSRGARTASFEGIRCETAEWRMYATAARNGTWVPVRSSKWRRIEESGLNRSRAALAKEYLCDTGVQLQSVSEILDKLRSSMSGY